MNINLISTIPKLQKHTNTAYSAMLLNRMMSLNTVNIRHFSTRDDGRIDDRPGGGPGMVINAASEKSH